MPNYRFKSNVSKTNTWFCILCITLLTSLTWAQVGSIIPLQGQLTQQDVSGGTGSEVAPDGVYTITVRIYEAATGSSVLWEDRFQNLPVINGVFNVMLGTQNGLDEVTGGCGSSVIDCLATRGVLYVGLTIETRDGIAVTSPVEMLPRLSLLPVPYAGESGNARELLGQDWSFYFDPGTANSAYNALQAENANTLDGFDWAGILENDNGTTPSGTNLQPNDDSYQIRSGLLPEPTSPGELLRTGVVLEFIGGDIDELIDPRSLDSDDDGIPDLPLSEARNLNGNPVTTTFQTWFVLVQNETGNLRFPDPNTTPGLTLEAMESYQAIHPTLQGRLIPSRSITRNNVIEETYVWTRLTGDGGLFLNRSEPSIEYDPILDAYWIIPQTNDSKLTLIWRDEPVNPNNYISRDVLLPTVETDFLNGLQVGLEVFPSAPGTNNHLLVCGQGVTNRTFTVEVIWNGSDRTTVSLVDLELTPNPPNPLITDYGSFLVSQDNTYFEIAGSDVANISSSRLSEIHKYSLVNDVMEYDGVELNLPAGYNSMSAVYDRINSIGYVFGGDDGSAYSDNLFIYDAGTRVWNTNPTQSGESPSPRQNPALFINPLNSNLIVFGGEDNTGPGAIRLNDLYKYDPLTNEWSNITDLQSTIRPDERRTSGFTFDTKRNRGILLGGRSNSGNNFGDLWELSFGGSTVTNAFAIKVD
jgi:hypothetical protein